MYEEECLYMIKSNSCAMPVFETVQEVEKVRKDGKIKGREVETNLQSRKERIKTPGTYTSRQRKDRDGHGGVVVQTGDRAVEYRSGDGTHPSWEEDQDEGPRRGKREWVEHGPTSSILDS